MYLRNLPGYITGKGSEQFWYSFNKTETLKSLKQNISAVSPCDTSTHVAAPLSASVLFSFHQTCHLPHILSVKHPESPPDLLS